MGKIWGRFGWAAGLILVVAGLVVVIGLWFRGSPVSSGSEYSVRRGNISAIVRTTGKLEPVRQLKLAFRVQETIRRIYVKPGDYVPAGTLLMELDTTQLERQLATAQAQRDISRFNFSAQAEKGQNQSVSELYSAARQSEQADNQVTNARNSLEVARLYAPFDGTILTVDLSEGDNANFGQQVATLADLTRFQVRAEIDEIDVANVAAGQTVQFTLDAFPGKGFEGKVSLVSPSPAQRQGSTIYPTTISFNRTPDLYLRPGMAANVSITSLSRSNVLLIPNRALETIGLRKYATRIRLDGTLEKVPVETGLSNPDQAEIISGLGEGDKVSVPR